MHVRAAQRQHLPFDVVDVKCRPRPTDVAQVHPVLVASERQLEHGQVLGGEERELVCVVAEGMAHASSLDLGVPLRVEGREEVDREGVGRPSEADAGDREPRGLSPVVALCRQEPTFRQAVSLETAIVVGVSLTLSRRWATFSTFPSAHLEET